MIISKWVNEKTNIHVEVVISEDKVKTTTTSSFNKDGQVNYFKNEKEIYARLKKGKYINYQVL